jgi:diphosphomevalonate decarboxylase
MATAIAHPNFALIKYWGKADSRLNIPASGSISLTVDKLTTKTTVRFNAQLKTDVFWLNGKHLENPELTRLQSFLDLIRGVAGEGRRAEVVSSNNFPTAAGVASSSSGFAALSLAASGAIGLRLTSEELSTIARRGSGSAARSIYGGFVELVAGDRADGRDSIAKPIADEKFWPLSILIAVTTFESKKIGSTSGMNLTSETSPYYSGWIESTRQDLPEMRAAIEARNFTKVGELMEHSCLKMHGAMLSARPGLIYWNAGTLEIIEAIKELRKQGHEAYFTIDAGPQVKIVCQELTKPVVLDALDGCTKVAEIIDTKPGPGAFLLEE